MTNTEEIQLSVASVSERDLDLLLLEELSSTPAFVRWLIEHVKLDVHKPRIIRASRSITQSMGESDLEVFIEDAAERVTCLLVENKIHAAFQPQQAQRYRERGASYVRNGYCHRFLTVLVAPMAYFGADPNDRKGFDSVVHYEAIRDWFSSANLGSRAHYKIRLLDSAISKARFGYQPEEDAPVTNFWRSYWHLATDLAPELEMTEPGPKPASSGFIYFRPPNLGKHICIVHKTRHGHVDLQFYRMGRKLQALRDKLGSYLQSKMTIQRASESAVIRIKVPKLNISADLQIQLEAVTECLKQAAALLAWYRKVQSPRSKTALKRSRT